MRQFLLMLVTAFACGPLCALPLGNPAEASMFQNGLFWGCGDYENCWFENVSLRIGYYGDFVYNRNLKINGAGLGQGKVMRKTELRTNAGYLALNYCDKVDVFGTLGASRLWIVQNEVSWVQAGNVTSTLQTDTHFSWSVGARASLVEFNCFTLGLEGQYFQSCFDITHYIPGTSASFNRVEELNGIDTKYHEWQVGLGLAYNVYICNPLFSMIPYLGVKWANVKYNMNNFRLIRAISNQTLTFFDLEANKHWGFAVGLTFTMCETIGITAEGRFADEQAFYVNGEFRF